MKKNPPHSFTSDITHTWYTRTRSDARLANELKTIPKAQSVRSVSQAAAERGIVAFRVISVPEHELMSRVVERCQQPPACQV